MSFRKRNVGLTGTVRSGQNIQPTKQSAPLPGVRPSPLDGRPTTSTGTATLDHLLAGHGGLVLGCTLLLEESGTTDYAGTLLRFYASEGLMQGHHVHVVGLPEQWGRELPGVVEDSDKDEIPIQASDKMKIAWRYESLGQFGTSTGARSRDRPSTAAAPEPRLAEPASHSSRFCHTFDLTKRLIHPASSQITFIALSSTSMDPAHSPFATSLDRLTDILAKSAPHSVHRVVVPSLLSPALYPPHSSLPQHVLPFLHGIRALLAAYPGRMTAMMSLPLSLYPRSSGLTRWMELLNDGVLELSPFPHSADASIQSPRGAGETKEEAAPHGILQMHRLPILHERGSGASGTGEDWTFTLTRRKFTIKPFNLPPVEGDTEAQQAAGPDQKAKKADLDF